MAGDVLNRIGADLLDAAVDALDAVSWPAGTYAALVSAPARRFVHAGGEPAWDCEQLAVWFGGYRAVGLTQPAELGPPRGPIVPIVEVRMHVLYDVAALDGDGVPTDAELAADGERLAAVGDALATHLLRLHASDALFPTAGISRAATTFRPGVETQGPQGGMAGWRVSLDVALV